MNRPDGSEPAAAGSVPRFRVTNVPLASLAIIAAIYLLVTLVTAVAAAAAGSPFTLWFRDTEVVLAAAVVLLVVMGIVWDGLWISAGLVSEILGPWRIPGLDAALTVEWVRRIRFFTCGLSSPAMIVMTTFVILGTSNITLLSLTLVGNVTAWRDPFFWAIEQPVFDGLARLSFDATAWDRLYHSAWGIELLAAFVLVLVARGPRIVAHYCVSLILLLYVGRWLGLMNPVMGRPFTGPRRSDSWADPPPPQRCARLRRSWRSHPSRRFIGAACCSAGYRRCRACKWPWSP